MTETGELAPLVRVSAPRRIHLIGGPGSGKTTLALELGRRLDLPVHELDTIAFIHFHETLGLARRRPLAERVAAVATIARTPVWISEGIAVGWTDPLLEAAELVVWLDLPWYYACWRILRRYLHAVRTDPLPVGVRRWQPRLFVKGLLVAFSPLGGSAVHRLPVVQRGLYLLQWWGIHLQRRASAPLDALDADRIYSRAATAVHLRPYASRLLRVHRPIDADAVLAAWRAGAGASAASSARHMQ